MKAKFSLLAYMNGKRVTLDITKKNLQPPKDATRFYLRYTDENGKRHDDSLGTDFHRACAEVRTKQAAREYEEKTGKKFPDEPSEEAGEEGPAASGKTLLRVKIEAWLDKFREKNERFHNNTWRSFRNIIYKFKDSCGREFVEDILRDDVFKFARELDHDDYATQTVASYFGVVMIFLKYAGIHLGIPTKERPDYDPRDVESYTPEQLDSLFLAATGEEALLFKSFLFTGMRNQEVGHLAYGDIDFKHSIWSVRSKRQLRWKAKSKAGVRRIPVPPFHTEDIHERMIRHERSGDDLVFPNLAGDVQHCYLDILKRLAKRADLAGRVDIHKFRSTCATMWLRAGVDIEEVRKRLGHSDYKMIQRYVEAWKLESESTREETTKTFERFDTIRSEHDVQTETRRLIDVTEGNDRGKPRDDGKDQEA